MTRTPAEVAPPRVPKCPTWVRNRWRGLVFAAGVTLSQLDRSIEHGDRASPPYVILLPDEPHRLSRTEIIGDTVLTEPLDITLRDRRRLTDSVN